MSPFLLNFLTTAVSCAVVGVLAVHLALRPWRKAVAEGVPWTEQARLLWPARRVLFAVLLGGVIGFGSIGHFSGMGLVERLAAAVCGAVAGSWPVSYFLERQLEPSLRFRTWLGHNVLGIGFLIVIGAVMGGAAAMIRLPLTALDGLVAAVALLLLVFLHSGWWLRWIKKEPLDSPEGVRLQALAARAAQLSGMTPRDTWLVDVPVANAFALPTSGTLIFTRRLLEVEKDDEGLLAICLHELAHLSESRTIRALRLLGALRWYPFIFFQPVREAWGTAGLLALYAAVFMAGSVLRRLERRLEERADASAAQAAPDAAAYARTLEKIHQSNRIPAVMPGRNETHPHLYDRMEAAGLTPDYPRPAAPASLTWPGIWAMILLIVLPIVAVIGLEVRRSWAGPYDFAEEYDDWSELEADAELKADEAGEADEPDSSVSGPESVDNPGR